MRQMDVPNAIFVVIATKTIMTMMTMMTMMMVD
jgi:hypothetical protein